MRRVLPKKYLGQHFLKDKNVAIDIINKLDVHENGNVLEIGPGMGMLTQFLIKKQINLKVIEIDNESISYLKSHYPSIKDSIIHGDFLQFNLDSYYNKASLSIIGNFPYNISSQILFKAFENRNVITQVVGMFQKEVAERIASVNKVKKGILSILMTTFYDIEYCFDVDKNLFSPSPKVESGVIKLTRNKRKSLECDEKLFIDIIKTSYNQRRKTLRNALKSFSLESDLALKKLLELRAEQLEVKDFIRITQHVEKKRNR